MTIVANLATYPPRHENLLPVVTSIASQVDLLNVVLNEYDSIPEQLASFPNVRAVIPDHDTKDAGKFYPELDGATYVLLIDDDLLYPSDYVSKTVERFEALGAGGFVAGYHASLYRKPKLSLRKWLDFLQSRNIANHRKVYIFYNQLDEPVVVDQVATNAAILKAADMPPYEYMKDSQKFVDVRLAKWCFEKGLTPIALPKAAKWLGTVRFDESIYEDFTKQNKQHVADEIWTYAFKVKNRGETL
ncbi:hypothetical protein [Pseudaestuariivita rosea]|uniref:hypothetical protein n=1 Tax=Pseudaestuariivita rosea TaxID=2763263 RepID=UPI001ABB0FF6|nr:hypothetical protein [Pseudaestuariivita rosea]